VILNRDFLRLDSQTSTYGALTKTLYNYNNGAILVERCSLHFVVVKLISKHQHGFLIKHSTCTNLLETVDD